MKRLWAIGVGLWLVACGGDDGAPMGPGGGVSSGGPGTSGVGTSTGMTGVTSVSSGGIAGGTTSAGSTTTTTGQPSTSGATGATGATSGTSGQATGETSGAAVAGDAGGAVDAGGPPLDPCAAVDPGAAAGAQAAAAAVLTTMSPCAFSSCHGDVGKGGLTLLDVDLQTLVGTPSCEAPQMPLIDGTGGAAALANSWIWQKMTLAGDDQNVLMGDAAAWGGPAACGQPGDQPYGKRMPLDNEPLAEDRLAPVRDWICLGAPAQ